MAGHSCRFWHVGDVRGECHSPWELILVRGTEKGAALGLWGPIPGLVGGRSWPQDPILAHRGRKGWYQAPWGLIWQASGSAVTGAAGTAGAHHPPIHRPPDMGGRGQRRVREGAWTHLGRQGADSKLHCTWAWWLSAKVELKQHQAKGNPRLALSSWQHPAPPTLWATYTYLHRQWWL